MSNNFDPDISHCLISFQQNVSFSLHMELLYDQHYHAEWEDILSLLCESREIFKHGVWTNSRGYVYSVVHIVSTRLWKFSNAVLVADLLSTKILELVL